MNLNKINQFILGRIKVIEMIGVLMRIFSFSLVSWLGPKPADQAETEYPHEHTDHFDDLDASEDELIYPI